MAVSGKTRRQQWLLFLGFGMFSLAAELLWMRLLALVLGGERIAMFSTTAGYFLGVAIGAWLLNRKIYASPQPLRWFGGCALLSALYVAITPWLFYALNRVALPGPVILWGLILMLPGTLCFGGMFTAMMSLSGRSNTSPGPGRLYAGETLGAALGAGLLLFVLLPRIGLDRAGLATAGVGLVVGLSAFKLGREQVPAQPGKPVLPRQQSFQVCLLGFVGLAIQVQLIHLLSQVLSNTVFTFGLSLVAYLAALSLGAWLVTLIGGRVKSFHGFATLMPALVFAVWCLIDLPDTSSRLLAGNTIPLLFAREGLVVTGVFLLPALCTGALFAYLLKSFVQSAAGCALSLNALGAALGALYTAWIGIPVLGVDLNLRVLLLLSLAGALAELLPAWRAQVKYAIWPTIIAALSWGLLPNELRLVEPAQEWQETARHEGTSGTVLVSTRNHLPMLQVNQYFMGGQLGFGEARLGHLAMLAHPAPKNVCVLGMGSGVTAGATLAHDIEHLDVVEIVPEVKACLGHFAKQNNHLAEDKRAQIHITDARRFLKQKGPRYDVIIADLFHPARDGAGSLYAREHFELIKQRLADDGVFVQWLPLYQLTQDSLATIVHTFRQVFPEVEGMMGLYNRDYVVLGLVAAHTRPKLNEMRRKLAPGTTASRYVDGVTDWIGSYWLDAHNLAEFSRQAALNTDLRPRLSFAAHDILVRPPAEICRENLAWLTEQRNAPLDWKSVALGQAHHDNEDVASYNTSVMHYLAAEALRSSPDTPPQVLIDRYLEAYEASPAFKPVTGQLVGIANRQPVYSDYIYPRMIQAQPLQDKPYLLYLKFLKTTGQGKRHAVVLREYALRFKPELLQPPQARPAPE